MRAVNLLPADRTIAKKPSRFSPLTKNPIPVVSGIAGFATVAGLAFMVYSTNTTISTKQQQLDAIEAQIAKLPAPQTHPQAATSTGAPVRTSVVQSLANARLPWDGFLDELSRVVPENVWLSSMQATSPGAAAEAQLTASVQNAASTLSSATGSSTATSGSAPAPAPTPASAPSVFTIQGFTYTQPDVARLMRRLTLIPWLSNVNLVSSVLTSINAVPVVQFSIGATVTPKPVVAS